MSGAHTCPIRARRDGGTTGKTGNGRMTTTSVRRHIAAGQRPYRVDSAGDSQAHSLMPERVGLNPDSAASPSGRF